MLICEHCRAVRLRLHFRHALLWSSGLGALFALAACAQALESLQRESVVLPKLGTPLRRRLGVLVNKHPHKNGYPRTINRSVILGIVSIFGWMAFTTAARPAAPALHDVSIVEFTGRPGHQSFFPIQGMPISGLPAIVRARLLGNATNLRLLMLERSGQVLAQVNMLVPQAGQTLPGTYFADITTPTVPFSFAIAGIDGAGQPFTVPTAQPALIAPSTLLVKITPTISEFSAGVPTHFQVQVGNAGAAGEVAIATSISAAGLVRPATVTTRIRSKRSETLDVLVTPAAIPNNTLQETLRVRAYRVSGPADANTAALTLPIALTRIESWSAQRRRNRSHRDLIIFACDPHVNTATIRLNSELVPTTVKVISDERDDDSVADDADQDEHHLNCQSPDLLKLTFDIHRLGLPVNHPRDRFYLPLTAFTASGAQLLAYLPFRVSDRNER